MSGMPQLKNSPVNIAAIREHARRELQEILKSVPEKKALVLDQKLAGPLGLVAERALLKDNGVEKTYYVLPGPLQTELIRVVYLVRPTIETVRIIASQILAHRERGEKKQYWIFFVPRKTILAERILEQETVYDYVTMGEYGLDFIPFDDDVLSLEYDMAFREVFVDGDTSALYYTARALVKMESMFGLFRRVMAKGHGAKQVVDVMKRLQRELFTPKEHGEVEPEIDRVIILDRHVDLVTPFLTQLTYEGLIDEIMGISNSLVEVDAELVGQQSTGLDQSKPKTIKIALNSNDKLYSDARDRNFSSIGPFLHSRANMLKEVELERHTLQDRQVSQIKDYVKKLKEMNVQAEKSALSLHTNIAEKIGAAIRKTEFSSRIETEQLLLSTREKSEIYDALEESVNREEDFLSVLRLVSLASATGNGIKKCETLQRDILQTYGYEKLFTLQNLARVGLMKKQESKHTFSSLRKSLRLVDENVDEMDPNDMSYVYSGYAPISARLVEHATVKQGWGPIDEALKLLPGPVVDETNADARPRSGSRDAPAVCLVVFIGGVTFTEISALRFIERKSNGTKGIESRPRTATLSGLCFQPCRFGAVYPLPSRSERALRPVNISAFCSRSNWIDRKSSVCTRQSIAEKFAVLPTVALDLYGASAACPAHIAVSSPHVGLWLLRIFLSRCNAKLAGKVRFLIATTKIINGHSLVRTLVENVDSGAVGQLWDPK